jgi:polar amino acid transport system substrate-binding protein
MRAPVAAFAVFLLAACSTPVEPPAAAVSDLAPGGTLRAAINVGNAVLAQRPAAPGGEPTGVSVDLARRLGVPLQLTVYDAAGKVVEAGRTGAWDIAFVALDPARASEIAQSPPYVQIEGAYLVREGSKLRSNEEVDRKGHRVVVGRNSAYDLFLTRNLQQAQIVRTPTSATVVDVFVKENHDVAAGVKQQLETDARRVPGVRLLPGRFMVINQAMASQKGREAGARYVRDFVEDVKASGFVAKALAQHNQTGAAVAP